LKPQILILSESYKLLDTRKWSLKVYISGYGMVSSLGANPQSTFGSLLENRSAIKLIEPWKDLVGLNCFLGAPAVEYDKMTIPRTSRRTMSPMSEMATLSAHQALEMSQIQIKDLEFSRSLMLMGSTTGSPFGMQEYFEKLAENNGPLGQSGTLFFKVMNHSVASNVASALGFNGAVIGPSCACASSAQALIMGWELIQSGLYDIAICGGADELHYLSVAVFDTVYAASRNFNNHPELTPRPFDKKRDGLVVSEGASVIILESESHLNRRKGKALGEFCGGAYLCESSHMSQNNEVQMKNVMNETLKRTQFKTNDIDYISAHATGTLQGDAQEAKAIAGLFGDEVPVSSLKAHFGHSMAACGAGELILSLKMMEEGLLIGTRNLDEVAEDCSGIYHLRKNTKQNVKTVLSNNFAFGGINTSCIIKSC
jgi:3-oxoacyl-[acyl-carrier-protein] synthase II